MGGYAVYIPARLLAGIISLGMIMCLSGCFWVCRQPATGSMPADGINALVVAVTEHGSAESLNHSVRPGTVVIWVNQSGNDIRVMFPDRKVTIACLSPVNFDSTADGFFISGRLSAGAVASLCLVQPGSYAYSIERSSGAGCAQPEGFRLEGSIIVR